MTNHSGSSSGLPPTVRERNVTAKIGRLVFRRGVTLAQPTATLSLSIPGLAGLDARLFARNLRLFRGADFGSVPILKRLNGK
jgi:hypothetical protein